MTQPLHGGNVYKAARDQRISVEQIMDYSASINPLGFPRTGRRAIHSALNQIAHYPDPDCWNLRQELAQQCRVDPDMILVGNGSTELIHLLPRGLGIKSALIIGPTFTEYARALMDAGSAVQYVYAKREDHFRPPLEETIRQLSVERTRFDAVFLCNPNNPTGRAMDREAMHELAQAVEQRQGWLIVDEAFIDYCQTKSVVSLLHAHPRMILLRSLTKFYAMPGLRVGYLLGASKAVERVRDRQPPWSVNSLAQEVSLAVLQDRAYATRSRMFMKSERARFMVSLRSLSDLRIYPSTTNFALIELPSSTSAAEVTDRLACDGILVRDCSPLSGFTTEMIRVAIRTPKENRRLIKALGVCLRVKQA